MNKKVLTLCAGMLLAGSMLSSVDAKIVISTPAVGEAYLIGTSAEVNANTYATLLLTNGVKSSQTVGESTATWTLEDAGSESFYLHSGNFYISASTSTRETIQIKNWTSGSVSNYAKVKFKLVDGKIAVADVTDFGSNSAIKADSELNLSSTLTLAVQGSGSSIVFGNYQNIKVTDVAEAELTSGSYLLMDDCERVLVDNGTAATWTVFDNENQASYWTVKVTDNGNNKGVAKFTNKKTGNYLATTAGAHITVDVTRTDAKSAWSVVNAANVSLSAAIDGKQTIALGIVKENGKTLTGAELTSITGSGFETSIKKFVDGDKKDKDLVNNPFSGLLKPVKFAADGVTIVAANASTDKEYMLQNEDGDIIVVDTDLEGAYADGTEAKFVVKAIGAKILANALKDSKNEIKNRYAYNFTFKAAEDFVIGVNQSVAEILVENAASEIYHLGSVDLKGVPTLAAEENAKTFLDKITIKVGVFNTIDVKKLLGNTPAFFTVTNVNTKAKYSDNYKTILGLDYNEKDAVEATYVDKDEAAVGYPETQWAITYKNGVLTLANRERPTVTKTYNESELYKVPGKDNVFAVLEGGANNDTIQFTANTDYTEADGYLRLNAAELRDQSYYVAAASSIFNGDEDYGLAYLVENHGNNHQVGLDDNKDNATEWNLATAMYRGLDNLGETIEYRPDTIQVKSILGYYKADGSYAETKDAASEGTTILKLLAYSFQNDENSEYLAYVDAKNRYATGDFGKKVGYKNDKSKANIFAIKTVGENLYNLVQLNNQNALDVESEADDRNWEAISLNKMYSGDGATKGILNNTPMYRQTENDLFTIVKKDAPEYRKVTMGDTISIFRNEDAQDVLFEKGEFLGTATSTGFEKANPALFVDTAYVNRPYNNRWEYLLAVNAKHWESKDDCGVEGHPKHEADTTTGRFLVNLMDSAYVYNETHLHNNKFINEEDGETCAKLGFVEGYHTHDTLYLKRPNGTYDKIAMDREDYSHSIAKFAFRYVDQNEGSFVIETGRKDWNDGEATSEVKTGYLKWLNGTLVVVDKIEAAEIFNMNTDETRTPTANENIAAGSVVVAGVNGAVVVKGAEGKNVIVSTILGKVVANEVVSSDNATIAAPAGIVVVSVDGESFKVVVK